MVDTGASHTLIGQDFVSRLGDQSDVPGLGIKARTATGDAMKTYGKNGKTYVSGWKDILDMSNYR